jgi:hypothetical protein
MERNDVIEAIDEINSVITESSLDVYDALLESYDKAETILENYDGDDISSFSFFQEGKIMDEVKKQGKGDKSVGKTILFFIPRLIAALFNAIAESTKNVIEDIKEDIPKEAIEKAKKEPNWFMKIIKSKPVKTLSLITITVGVTKASSEIKQSIKLMKEAKESAMSITELVQKREELLKKSPVIEWDNTLMLSTSLKYDEIEGFGSKYFIECLSIIRVATNDIKKCKNVAEVLSVLSNLQKESLKYMYPFEVLLGTISGDDVVMYGPIKPKDLCEKLKIGIENLKKVNRDDIKKAMTDLYNAIPRDTLTKGLSNKVSTAMIAKKISSDNKSNDGLAVIDKTFEDTTNAVTMMMLHDIKMYCDIISAIRTHIHDTFVALRKELKSARADKPKEDGEPVDKES